MMNGVDLDGGSVDGLRLTAFETGTLQGQEPITDISLDGETGELTLTTANKTVSGVDVEGATWTFSAEIDNDTDQPFQLTIHEVNYHPAGVFTGGALYSYVFSTSWWDTQADDWTDPAFDICTDGADDPVGAFLVPGKWDTTTGDPIGDGSDITIACRRAALAKCMTWGYRPGNNDPAAADRHQACTRMVRADYLGEGTPYTLNGTLIYVGDALAINDQAKHGSSTVKEAEWGPDGATCIERFYLRQRQLTGCTGTPNTPDCWQGQNGEPNIPDCAVTSDLDPETSAELVTAVPHAYEDELTVGVIWENPSAAVGIMSRDPSGSQAYGNDTITLAAGEVLDGAVRHRVFGYRAFINDTVGGSARLVGVWSNGDLEDIGSSIPGRQFFGAANIAEDNGRTVYALDEANDQLCTVSILTGELYGCKNVVDDNNQTFDISELSDLTADDAEGSSFTMVNGGTELYTLTLQGNVWQATHTDDSPDELNGVAHSANGITYGLSYTDNNFIRLDTGAKISNGGNGGSLVYGDLAALPLGEASTKLGEGPEAVVDGVCSYGELPANADCDGVCDPQDDADGPDCGYQGFCNQFDGRAVSIQSQHSSLYLEATSNSSVFGNSSYDDDARWNIECDGSIVWIESDAYADRLLKANTSDVGVLGNNPTNGKQKWIPYRNADGTWTLENKGRGKYLAIGQNKVSVGPTWGDAKHMIIRDLDREGFCDLYDGEDVYIQHSATGRYVDSGADGDVGSTTTTDTSWALTCSSRTVRLRSNDTGKHLSALSGGDGADVREDVAAGPNARWSVIDNGDGTWSLQSTPRETYMTVDSSSDNTEQRDTRGATEAFTFTVAS